MSLRLDRSLSRLCLLGVLVAALGLAACGRKGNLDKPPSAAVPTAGEQVAATPIGGAEVENNKGDPLAPAPKKRIFLDGLLD